MGEVDHLLEHRNLEMEDVSWRVTEIFHLKSDPRILTNGSFLIRYSLYQARQRYSSLSTLVWSFETLFLLIFALFIYLVNVCLKVNSAKTKSPVLYFKLIYMIVLFYDFHIHVCRNCVFKILWYRGGLKEMYSRCVSSPVTSIT